MSSFELTIYTPITDLSEKETAEYRKTKIDAAAECIYGTIDNSMQKEYSKKKISEWLMKIDKDNNGTLTADELVLSGGDSKNILKMSVNTPAEEHEALQSAIYKEQELCGIKGMEKGLNTKGLAWSIAKPIIVKYSNKADIMDMFKNPAVIDYYEGMNDCSKAHMLEILVECGFNENEIKDLGIA